MQLKVIIELNQNKIKFLILIKYFTFKLMDAVLKKYLLRY